MSHPTPHLENNASATKTLPLRAASVGVVAAVAVVLAWTYAPLLARLANLWKLDPSYSHAPLVILVSLVFAVGATRRGPALLQRQVDRRGGSRGLALLLLGLGLHLMAWITNIALADVLSLVLVLLGVCYWLGGTAAAGNYRFACGFLLFAAPLPIVMQQTTSLALQEAVATVTAITFDLLTLPVFREGYHIFLPGYTIEIGEACSGLGQGITFLALAALIAHLCGRRLGFNLALMLLSLVAAVTANWLRIMLTATVLYVAGPEYAEGVFHTLEGLIVLALGTLVLVGLTLLLARIDDWLLQGPSDAASSIPSHSMTEVRAT